MSARTDTEATSNQNSSGVTPATLDATLREKLEAQHVDIADLSGTSTNHFPHLPFCGAQSLTITQAAAAKCSKP